MKALLLNGSPRKGNTHTALAAIEEGLKTVEGMETETIVIHGKRISPCMACEACRGNGGNCVIGDDGNEIVEKLAEADIVVFGTPVYWWGMTAQMKLVIDRMYSKSEGKLSDKKIGLVITGGDALDNPQYTMIEDQMKRIARYLDWEIVFSKKISANERTEIADNAELIEELTELGKKLK